MSIGGKAFHWLIAAVVIFILALVVYALALEPDPGRWSATHLGWMGIASLVLGGLGMLLGLVGGGSAPLPDQRESRPDDPTSGGGHKSTISVGGNITAGRDVVVGDKVTTVVGSGALPRKRDDGPAGRSGSLPSGAAKLLFTQRLGDDWRALADVLEIPLYEQQRFGKGDEARGIRAWLEVRKELHRLPAALRHIGRGDLADALASLE